LIKLARLTDGLTTINLAFSNKMHENNDTNNTREYNATDITDESILYTILVNDLATVSTSMPSTIYNDTMSTTAYV